MRQRKRCPYCRCLFVPDGRVAKRQRACCKTSCQAERRRETQRRYRQKHPEDAAARRLRAAIAAAKAGAVVPLPRAPPAELGRFPWEELRDEISPQALVITGLFVRLALAAAQDEIRAEVLEIKRQSDGLVARVPKDETAERAASG